MSLTDWHEYQTPTCISELVYEIPLNTKANYIYDLQFQTHPLLLERSTHTASTSPLTFARTVDRYRLTSADIDYVQLVIDGRAVSTLTNYYRDEPTVNSTEINGIHSVSTEFLGGDPIITGLLNTIPVMRIVFWRKPVAPFWLSYRNGVGGTLRPLALSSTWSGQSALSTHGPDGWLYYRWGTLCP